MATDEGLVALWRAAEGRRFTDVIQSPAAHPDVEGITAESLACLAEAGLLVRSPSASPPAPELPTVDASARVTAVIVVSVPGELKWLEECVRSLMDQDRPLTTILVLDNAVGVDMTGWLAERGLRASVHTLARRTNFATALNNGCAAAPDSDFFLLLNADMRADRSCVRHLVARAAATPDCAAVAPKLYFWRAPAFLNGIGNRVPGWGYGTDNGVGQLDLSQLDDWTEVPSGCLGALLVSARALREIGGIDTRYPLYYEDTDWCYRARVQGLRIAAAPQAWLLHAFGATWSGAEPSDMQTRKLESVVIGQLRFGLKIGSPGRAGILTLHALKDASMNVLGALRHGRIRTLGAYGRAGLRTLAGLPALVLERRCVQSRRRVPDAKIFLGVDDLTPSFVWRNLPELTCANIRSYYAPLLRAGKTRALPEISS